MTSTSQPLQSSPFLTPASTSKPSTLSLLFLKRDHIIPVILQPSGSSNPTDHITNTRFGAYPHSTLTSLPWGSQVIASNVGARERNRGRKRKRNLLDAGQDHVLVEDDDDDDVEPAFKAASSGFAHLLAPTAELWTRSLPHRTQVVYTPDSSYILQRLRVRPGWRMIEAGAGSGSFTHAAVRAVFNGYPDRGGHPSGYGKVYSFEYHEPRFESLQQEITEHGLEGLVTVTHRDVYADGFAVEDEGGQNVSAVFLDLPAPWLALPKLVRGKDGPLHPDNAVSLCSFSPCIEQAQRAAATLRDLGWVDVGMAAVQHRRIDIRRERIGLQEEGLRGVNAAPSSVEEAVGRLRELEGKQADFHARRKKQLERNGRPPPKNADAADVDVIAEEDKVLRNGGDEETTSKQRRLKSIAEAAKDRKLFKAGKLVHRTEPEMKTHTSYLVFATLPREWTDEDERRCVEENERNDKAAAKRA
jgi:tRNA (adenine57-N1/adenine58-N1)-methyltransferase